MTTEDILLRLQPVRRTGTGWMARCPCHRDRKFSLSISEGSDGRTLINCLAGCSIENVLSELGLKFADLFPAKASALLPPMSRRALDVADDEAARAEKRKTWPLFESPLTGGDDTPARAMGALAELRHVSLDGVQLMAERGLLYFAAWKDSPAWIVTDGERVNAQARRMDGQPWPGIDAKAQTLPGSRAAWPIGARESLALPFVLLCEGVDILAAHHFIAAHGREADTAAVAMLGAGMDIPPDALPLFAGKRIRIMAHADKAGLEAALKWKSQLDTVGAHIDAVDFTGLLMTDGSPVKDLNDCTQLRPEDKPQLETLIPTE